MLSRRKARETDPLDVLINMMEVKYPARRNDSHAPLRASTRIPLDDRTAALAFVNLQQIEGSRAATAAAS
jgi:hypothetical protein